MVRLLDVEVLDRVVCSVGVELGGGTDVLCISYSSKLWLALRWISSYRLPLLEPRVENSESILSRLDCLALMNRSRLPLQDVSKKTLCYSHAKHLNRNDNIDEQIELKLKESHAMICTIYFTCYLLAITDGCDHLQVYH
jgi:hypothetical protein